MQLSNKELLSKIQQQIPEFDAEQNEGSWIWTFRCLEQEEGSGSLTECFINFVATIIDTADAEMGLDDEECDY